MLAHKAEDEGVAAAELIAGQAGHVDFETVPKVIYTAPEIGGSGQTEEQLKRPRRLPGRHIPLHRQRPRPRQPRTDGFVKFLADAKTDRVLGVHTLGPMAEALIAEGRWRWSSAVFRGHCTHLSRASVACEAVKEAALGRRQTRDQFLIDEWRFYSTTILTSLPDFSRSPGSSPLSTRKRST